MNDKDIKPGECYELANGKLIRVMTVFAGQVRYDVFDDLSKTWHQSATPIPIAMLKGQKACPVSKPPVQPDNEPSTGN